MKKSKKIIATLAFVAAIASSSLGVATLKQATAENTETTAFGMIQGASVRLSEVTGLRFQVELGQKEYKTITDDTQNVELGMMILPEPYVTSYETAKASDPDLTYHEHLAGKTIWDNIIADGKIFAKSDLATAEQAEYYRDGYYYASGVISEVLFNNYNRNFVAVAYTKTTGADNAISYTYTAASPARNVAYVASAAYENEDWGNYKSTVEGFIEDSVYNLAGVTYDSANEKYVYSEDSYDTKAEVKAAAGEIAVSVNANDVMLTGKTQTATAALTVGENAIDTDVTYSVGDKTVATIEENGLVTAQKINGTTTVKASAFGGMYSAETAVTVSDGNIFTKAEGYRSGWVGTMAVAAARAETNSTAGRSDSGYIYDQLYEIEGTTQGYWHADEGVYKFYKQGAFCNYLHGCVRYKLTDSDPLVASPALRALLDEGTQYVKFEVKVDETFMSTTSTMEAYTSIQMCWAEGRDSVGNGTNAVSAISVPQVMLKAGEYVTVAVDISDLLAKYNSTEAVTPDVYFILGGKLGSEICLKDFAPITEDEYYEIYNPFSYMGGGKASILPTANLDSAKLSQVWDEEEGAFTVNLKLGYFDRNNGTDCARFNIDNFGNVNLPFVSNFIKRLSDSRVDGKAYIKFDVKVDEAYVNTAAPNGKKFSFWVRSDSLKASTGEVLNDVGVEASASNLTANTWTTLYVDASKFLELYDISDLDYFQFTMYGPAGSKVSFRNLQVATQAEYEANS